MNHKYPYWNSNYAKKFLADGWEVHTMKSTGYQWGKLFTKYATSSYDFIHREASRLQDAGYEVRIFCGYEKTKRRIKLYTIIKRVDKMKKTISSDGFEMYVAENGKAYNDRFLESLPNEERVIEIVKKDIDGEHVYKCQWKPFKEEEYQVYNMPGEGYLGTATVIDDIYYKRIGFHAWEQNENEFRYYRVIE